MPSYELSLAVDEQAKGPELVDPSVWEHPPVSMVKMTNTNVGNSFFVPVFVYLMIIVMVMFVMFTGN